MEVLFFFFLTLKDLQFAPLSGYGSKIYSFLFAKLMGGANSE